MPRPSIPPRTWPTPRPPTASPPFGITLLGVLTLGALVFAFLMWSRGCDGAPLEAPDQLEVEDVERARGADLE